MEGDPKPNYCIGATVNRTTVGQPPEQSEKPASLQISAELQRPPACGPSLGGQDCGQGLGVSVEPEYGLQNDPKQRGAALEGGVQWW